MRYYGMETLPIGRAELLFRLSFIIAVRMHVRVLETTLENELQTFL